MVDYKVAEVETGLVDFMSEISITGVILRQERRDLLVRATNVYLD
jgi:hypothetical protein